MTTDNLEKPVDVVKSDDASTSDSDDEDESPPEQEVLDPATVNQQSKVLAMSPAECCNVCR